MNVAIETVRCIGETGMACNEQQRELLTTVILNARFLNRNLALAVDRFNAWEEVLVAENPGYFHRLRCMLMNARRNFDAALVHADDINQWLYDDKLAAGFYSKA